MAVMTNRPGAMRTRRAFSGPRRVRAPRRKLIWIPLTFSPGTLTSGQIQEYVLADVATLQSTTLGRGTVVAIYGRMVITVNPGAAQDDYGTYCWGIRLKEADSPSTSTAFSPYADGDSSEWQTWRSGSLLKTSASGTYSQGNPASHADESFVIRNPRKVDADEELCMVIEAGAGNTAGLTVMFWCRVGLVLP